MHRVTQPAAAHKFEHLMVSVDDAGNVANMAQDIIVMRVIGAFAVSIFFAITNTVDDLMQLLLVTPVYPGIDYTYH